ncbi:MAG: hypothetical protein C4332_12130 [Meiothermus sp.]
MGKFLALVLITLGSALAQGVKEAALEALKTAGAQVMDCAKVGDYPVQQATYKRRGFTEGRYAVSFKVRWQVCAVTKLYPKNFSAAMDKAALKARISLASPGGAWESVGMCLCGERFYVFAGPPLVKLGLEFHPFVREQAGVITSIPGGFVRVYQGER